MIEFCMINFYFMVTALLYVSLTLLRFQKFFKGNKIIQ